MLNTINYGFLAATLFYYICNDSLKLSCIFLCHRLYFGNFILLIVFTLLQIFSNKLLSAGGVRFYNTYHWMKQSLSLLTIMVVIVSQISAFSI